jgi:hypothetical protein
MIPPKTIPRYLRSKRSWFVIDKEDIMRLAEVNKSGADLLTNDKILQGLHDLK